MAPTNRSLTRRWTARLRIGSDLLRQVMASRSATRWARPSLTNGISGRSCASILQLGGLGFLLGDGGLTYGLEKIFETYYTAHIWRGVSFAADWQHITNPGYNEVRGPVSVVSFRIQIEDAIPFGQIGRALALLGGAGALACAGPSSARLALRFHAPLSYTAFKKCELRRVRRRSNLCLIAQNHRPVALSIVKYRPLRQPLAVRIAVGGEVHPIRRQHVGHLMVQIGPGARRQQVLGIYCASEPGARCLYPSRRESLAPTGGGGLMREVKQKGLRTSRFGLRARPHAHDKRQLIAKRRQLRRVCFLIRCPLDKVLGTHPPDRHSACVRTLHEFRGRGGLQVICSPSSLVRPGQQRDVVLACARRKSWQRLRAETTHRSLARRRVRL